MMKKIILTLCLFSSMTSWGQANYGDVVGTVQLENEEGVYGARVWIDDNDKKYQTYTDADGRFRMSGIPSGKFKLTVASQGDTVKGVIVNVPLDGIGNAGIIYLTGKSILLGDVNVSAVYQKLKLKINATPTFVLEAEEIARSPLKNDPKGMIANATSDVQLTEDGELVIRGSRKGDLLYMIDGIKMRQVMSVPSSAIKSMVIYTGGIPAKYGDTMGGVVVLETKGYFDLLRERKYKN
jgi:hypothetical protein